MIISYFGYGFRKIGSTSHKNHIGMLKKFLDAYINYNNPAFKNKFHISGENQYLFKESEDLFVFVQTRSEDLIKKIDSSDISIDDIRSTLESTENIGFASYIYIKDSYIAYGSTYLAPKVNIFSNFVNLLMNELGIKNYEFSLALFEKSSTREKILNAPFIGKSTFQVLPEHSFFKLFTKNIKETITAKVNDFEDLECIEITIRPKKRKDVKEIAQTLLENIPDDKLLKAVFRAREDINSNLLDLHLIQNSKVTDTIDLKSKKTVTEQIKEKIENNKSLLEKVEDYEKHCSTNTIAAIAHYFDTSAWPHSSLGLQFTKDSTTTDRAFAGQ